MRVVTVHNVTFQFDADIATNGSAREQALAAIDTINEQLHIAGIDGAILVDEDAEYEFNEFDPEG